MDDKARFLAFFLQGGMDTVLSLLPCHRQLSGRRQVCGPPEMGSGIREVFISKI